MGERQPLVYVLNGEDEFAITKFVASLQAGMGDATTADMNTSRLEGRGMSLNQLSSAVNTIPFLSPRRLVIVSNPLAFAANQQNRTRLTEVLSKVPATTTLVLTEYRLLTEDKDRRAGRLHWLEKWAQGAGDSAVIKTFALPRGAAMEQWVVTRTKALGGRIEPDAARRLVALLGDEPRLAEQEIQKFMAYVNYSRPIGVEDVENLAVHAREGDIFALVDAIGNKEIKKAQEMLHRLLDEQEALSILAMIVRQFRLLLQAREEIERGHREQDIARDLKIHPYVAGKVAAQAQRFSLAALEKLYRRLLEIDEAIKTGQMEDVLALDMLVVSVTT